MNTRQRSFEYIGVYHLVRKANGLEPLKDFAASLRQTTSKGWKLIVIYKGFAAEDSLAEYRQIVSVFRPEEVFVSDEGYDIAAYFKAVEATSFETIVLFNSFAEILSSDWLDTFRHAFAQPDVGIVGATASYESTSTGVWLTLQQTRGFAAKFFLLLKFFLMWLWFKPFPNPHLRSNAVMTSRASFLATKRRIRTKLDALRFESGRHGLTNYFVRRHMKAILVTRDRQTIEAKDWPTARVFRQAEQEQLLVADNQTRAFARASQETRRVLHGLAWRGRLEREMI